MMVTKAEARKIFKEKRKQIGEADKEKWTDLILINFQKVEFPFINCVHTYLAMESQQEIDTRIFTDYLKFINPGLKIVVPKINLDAGEMRHYILNDDTELLPNDFGIVEPVKGEKVNPDEIDMVITPLLAFDKQGYRVGYGKGFYDKFFTQCREDVVKIGLSYFEPVEMITNINQFDISLNYCVTPQTVYGF